MMDTVIGVFADRAIADDAVQDFENQGFSTRDISIITKREVHSTERAGSKGGTAASAAASGAATGGIIGGLAGLLVGLGAITIPGAGIILIGGPLAAALGLTGVLAATVSGATTGILTGSLVGALVGLGLPEEHAKMYEERIREGAILLAVPVASAEEEIRVRRIFTDHQADQVRSIGGMRMEGYHSSLS